MGDEPPNSKKTPHHPTLRSPNPTPPPINYNAESTPSASPTAHPPRKPHKYNLELKPRLKTQPPSPSATSAVNRHSSARLPFSPHHPLLQSRKESPSPMSRNEKLHTKRTEPVAAAGAGSVHHRSYEMEWEGGSCAVVCWRRWCGLERWGISRGRG